MQISIKYIVNITRLRKKPIGILTIPINDHVIRVEGELFEVGRIILKIKIYFSMVLDLLHNEILMFLIAIDLLPLQNY